MRRRNKAYEGATRKSELWLAALAKETGGDIFLPASVEEMITQGERLAHEIGIQYVVTYRPKRPLSLAVEEEYRSINIATTRAGLQIHSPGGYVSKMP